MKDKKELVYDLANTLVAILFSCIIICIIILNIPGSKEIDGALIANVLVFGATLFAPLAAYHLLSDWKEQHKFERKIDFILKIRQEMRELETELFNLRNFYTLDMTYPYSNSEEVEKASKIYEEHMTKFNNRLNKIEDLFEDLTFILKTSDFEKKRAKDQINSLRAYTHLSKRAHRIIYTAIKNNKTNFEITESFAKYRAAYDDLYDGPNIETNSGDREFQEGASLRVNIGILKDICFEIYEPGYSKNRSLLSRLLEK